MKAFPEVKYVSPQGGGSHVMAVEGGMDLRDYFAAKAMQALVSRKDFEFEDEVWETAYDIADSMLKARDPK